MATTHPRRARARSVTASRRSSVPPSPTCSPSSSTTARTTWPAGNRCSVQALARAGEVEAAAARRRLERARGDRRRGLSTAARVRAKSSRRARSRRSRPRRLPRWPDFRWRTPEPFSEMALRLVHERPANLLDPRFPDWDAWLADVAADTVRELPEQCVDLAACTWGKVNTPSIQHPISEALPFVSRFLDMPRDALAGRLVDAARAVDGFRRLRAIRRIAGTGSGRLPAHAGRAERASALAVLPRRDTPTGWPGRPTPFLPGPRGPRPASTAGWRLSARHAI